jgi:uncharacterized RDD family membrane protein YckC
MKENNETYGILSQESNTFNEFVAPTLPAIANFWRRIFAMLLDNLIIGVAGFIISLPFSFLLFKLGPYGGLIGLFISLPYFGIMNSKICNGQTFGKRILKIAVRNKNNKNISLPLSFARIAILLIPNIFAISFGIKFLDGLFSIISTSAGLAIVLIYIFNKKNRQSLHDMVVGTYVVHLVDKRIYEYPKTEKKFWVLSGILVVCAGLLLFISTTFFTSNVSQTSYLFNLYENNNIPKEEFFNIGFKDRTSSVIGGEQTKTLLIECWYKGKITNEKANELTQSVAYALLNEGQFDLEKYDYLGVTIYSKYDIGIARSQFYISKTLTVDDWKALLLDYQPANDL